MTAIVPGADRQAVEKAGPRPRPAPVSPEFALLGFLALQPAHGYELHRLLQTRLGHIWSVSESQTYATLKRLESRGFIRGVMKRETSRPAQREFHLTGTGRARLDEWLRAPGRASIRAIRTEFLTRLFFTLKLRPGDVAGLIDAQAEQVRAVMAQLAEQKTRAIGDQLVDQLGIELRLNQLAAMLGWLSACRRRVVARTDDARR